MTDDKEKGVDERLTWNEGDLEITGPDGKPVDLKKLAEEGAAVADGPTVHVYLPEE